MQNIYRLAYFFWRVRGFLYRPCHLAGIHPSEVSCFWLKGQNSAHAQLKRAIKVADVAVVVNVDDTSVRSTTLATNGPNKIVITGFILGLRWCRSERWRTAAEQMRRWAEVREQWGCFISQTVPVEFSVPFFKKNSHCFCVFLCQFVSFWQASCRALWKKRDDLKKFWRWGKFWIQAREEEKSNTTRRKLTVQLKSSDELYKSE